MIAWTCIYYTCVHILFFSWISFNCSILCDVCIWLSLALSRKLQQIWFGNMWLYLDLTWIYVIWFVLPNHKF